MASEFTIRVIGSNPYRATSQSWRAGQIVEAMAGCRVESIVCALRAYERDDTPKGIGDPARWLSHFAGLESDDSGKAMAPWIEILYGGEALKSLGTYRELLRSRSERVSCQ